MVHLLAGIAWDPQIRGFLAVGVGVVVLLGSVYLIVGTNLGARLGFLLSVSAIFGWCTIMGVTWWVYGSIGMLGEAPKWEVTEVVYDSPPSRGLPDAELEEAQTLDTSALPDREEFHELEGDDFAAMAAEVEPTLDSWVILPESDPSFGEAKATVDEWFVVNPDEELDITGAEDYVTVYSFERGGKSQLPENPSRLDRIANTLKTTFLELRHPPHYAIIQVQRVEEQETVPGEAPPTPIADESTPVVSVIMERNLGDVRFPSAMLTIFSGIMFAVCVSMLHRRDLRAAEVRGLLPPAAGAERVVGQYLPVVALAVLAVVFAAVSRLASRLLAPSATTDAKRAPYECGIVPTREAPERFPVRFYLVAMIFIVFDIEIIFLYPWAVIYRDLGALGLGEVLLFTVAVLAAFMYLLSHGALDWGPAVRRRLASPMVSADRTIHTTVRRVGLDGRGAPAPPDSESEEAA